MTFCSITRPAEPNTRQTKPAHLQNPAGPARINFSVPSPTAPPPPSLPPTVGQDDPGPPVIQLTQHRNPHLYLYRSAKTLASVVVFRPLLALLFPFRPVTRHAWGKKRDPDSGAKRPRSHSPCPYLHCSSNGEEAVALSGAAAAARRRERCGVAPLPRSQYVAARVSRRSMRLWCGP